MNLGQSDTLVGRIVSLPGWWYTRGLGWLWQQIRGAVVRQSRVLNIGVWFRYLFVPMFGEKDRTGRIISFLVRLGQIIFRSVALVLLVAGLVVLLVAWLVWPFLIIYLLVGQMR